jgi:putative transposase
MLRIIEKPLEENQVLRTTLYEFLQQGAMRLLQGALDAEVDEYVKRHRHVRDASGRAQVVRNGRAPARQLVTATGAMEVRAPRVNDRRIDGNGRRRRFTSEILTRYVRRVPQVTKVLPIIYLRGLSTGDFSAALRVLVGKQATWLSPTTLTRLSATWQSDHQAWRSRSLADAYYEYVWVDGVHFRMRHEDNRFAALVTIGVRPDGTKELVAVEDNSRESPESWSALLHDLKRRGLCAPAVAAGCGAHGFREAVADVWPETRKATPTEHL